MAMTADGVVTLIQTSNRPNLIRALHLPELGPATENVAVAEFPKEFTGDLTEEQA